MQRKYSLHNRPLYCSGYPQGGYASVHLAVKITIFCLCILFGFHRQKIRGVIHAPGSTALSALALTACAAQTPQEQLAPASPTVRLCEGNNCSELPRNVATFRGEPVNPEAERRLAALVQRPKPICRRPRPILAPPMTWSALSARRRRGAQQLSGHRVDAQGRRCRSWPGPVSRSPVSAGLEEMGPDPAEAEAWLSRAAAKGFKEAKSLLPQAQAAKQNAHARYQAIEDERKSWNPLVRSAPYYWCGARRAGITAEASSASTVFNF
jgi:hypothetical protein